MVDANEEAHEAASDLFRCLASPVRIAIVSKLGEGKMCVHQLVDELGLAQPKVSQHLRILRDNRLVTRVRRGREMAYELTDHHVSSIVFAAIEHATEEHDHD